MWSGSRRTCGARRPGAGIALNLPNGPAFALLFLAAARAGREAQVLDPAWPAALTRKTLAAVRLWHELQREAAGAVGLAAIAAAGGLGSALVRRNP